MASVEPGYIPQVRSASATGLSTGRRKLGTRRPVSSSGPLFRLHRRDYPRYQAEGWQIGSGHIEAACKTVVNQRLKQSGMHWGGDGGPTPSVTCGAVRGRARSVGRLLGAGHQLMSHPSTNRRDAHPKFAVADPRRSISLIAASLPLPPVNAGLRPTRRGSLWSGRSPTPRASERCARRADSGQLRRSAMSDPGEAASGYDVFLSYGTPDREWVRV